MENRMYALIFFCILGLYICQTLGQDSDNSTQMLYAKLRIDENAIANVTEILKPLKPFVTDTTLVVGELKWTTTCERFPDRTECTCETGYSWSDTVCQSEVNKSCKFTQNSSGMCVSINSVTLNGSVTFRGEKYLGCLAKQSSVKFKECNADVSKQLQEVYSTLEGFDTVKVIGYRVGSVIADFEVTIAHTVDPQDLIDKTKILISKLSASLELKTTESAFLKGPIHQNNTPTTMNIKLPHLPCECDKNIPNSRLLTVNRDREVLQFRSYLADEDGVVHITMPSDRVLYNSKHDVKCTLKEDLGGITPSWTLRRDEKYVDINNGTGSIVTIDTLETKVELNDITELWAGLYTCVYEQKNKEQNYTITHSASDIMDVCLLPNIDITTAPGYPNCKERLESDLVKVRAICEIPSSSEKYTVTWESEDIDAEIIEIEPASSKGPKAYGADAFVSCSQTKKPKLICIFKNRCMQNRTAKIPINIIYAPDAFCRAEGDWGDTKAGFDAVLKCNDNSAGQRRRRCVNSSTEPTWGKEYSGCVNNKVNDVLQKSKIVGIGLGELNENAASVFSLLRNVTIKTDNIDSGANINASVYVLYHLSQQRELNPNSTATDDFLDSSSNMLDKSLNNSWKADDDHGNLSMAERYLSSVEEIIQLANLTNVNTKKKNNIEVDICSQKSECKNTVFNVTIILNSPDPGSVKSAGFRELQEYLPNNDSKQEPNSIVVSTTTERSQSGNVEVRIAFPLIKPRPRNVQMECVAWDNNTRKWSKEGCEWQSHIGGPSEGHCVCTHLSSFAILMSKEPLELLGMDQLTHVGLSVSIMSLTISLVIEAIVWSAVVKTNTLFLRHIAHVNISLCLLVADCCFLASSEPKDTPEIWCLTSVVLKHFCYLSMFFWMMCLSIMLLHQTVFLFHNLSKKNYLRFSLVLGYVCPLLIVAITILANGRGAEGSYYSKDTCWLVYIAPLKGSIHTFILPVGIIVIVNIFSMVVVILKVLDHPKNMDKSHETDKKAAKTVLRTVILLTPIFGVTWILGFAVMLLDLTYGDIAYIVNYAFTALNAFQGLFILLTTCLGDRLTREALINRLQKVAPSNSATASTTKTDSTLKK